LIDLGIPSLIRLGTGALSSHSYQIDFNY